MRTIPTTTLLAARVIALGLLFAPAASSDEANHEAPRNLIRNGGFEGGAAVPDWWRRYPARDEHGNRHLRDTAVFHSGQASALLWSVQPQSKGKPWMQWNRYGISVAGIAGLEVSFYVKTDGVPAAGVGCHFYDTQGGHLGFVPIPGPERADSWQRVVADVRVPPNAAKMGFVLYGANNGKTWYDDVEVLVDAAAAARRAELTKQFAIRPDDAWRVVPAHSLQKIPRHEPVACGPVVRAIKLEAACDETEAFQLVVIAGKRPAEGVNIELTPLAGPGGKLTVQWHRVGYVKTAPPSYPVEYVGWWPDPLLPSGPFDVPAATRQPLWFSISVPADASPGVYCGRVTIRQGDRSVATPVELRVRSFRLPRPGRLATAFGLYASALAHGYDEGRPYQDAMPVETFQRWCRFLAERRLGVKNVAREYISVEKHADGWHVDLNALDQTVGQLAQRYYAPYSFCLHRLPVSAALRGPQAKPDLAAWVERTAAIAAEWKRRSLPAQVYIYGPDEPHPSEYPDLQKLYTLLREAVPDFPILQTIGDANPEALAGLVDIWCPLTPRADSEFYRRRLSAGDTLWTYVCCSPKPPYANFFIDQPAVDHRVLFWQVRKLGATGLLYWCMCWWDGLPTPAAGKPCFPDVPIDMAKVGTYRSFKVNGDGFLLYPGPEWTPYSSIRLEVIRDGIEDYEYLALLATLVNRARSLPLDQRPRADLIAEAERLCHAAQRIAPHKSMTGFTEDANEIFAQRRLIGEMIERLHAELGSRLE